MKRREATQEEIEAECNYLNLRKKLGMTRTGYDRRIRVWFGRQNSIVQHLVLGVWDNDPAGRDAIVAGVRAGDQDAVGVKWGPAEEPQRREGRAVVARLGPDGIRRIA